MSNRQKLFDHFLSAGFSQVNQNRVELKHHAEMFDFNYSKYLPCDHQAKILEIGFGMGQFLYFLRENEFENFYGIEVSSEMYDFVKENIDGVEGKIELVRDIEVFLLGHKGEYALIVFNDVIEHLEKDKIVTYLEMIREALAEEGTVLIKTNNVAATTGARMRYEDFTHETSFTPYSLRQVLLVAGYSDVQIKPFTFKVTGPLRFLRKAMQKLIHFCWRMTYYFEYTTQPEVVDEYMFAVAGK